MKFLVENWHPTWNDFFRSQEIKDLLNDVDGILAQKKETIFPQREDIFKAFSLTPLDKVKLVLLGQAPYHNEGEAMGLSFSVPKGIKIPKSLQNIFKAYNSFVGEEKLKYLKMHDPCGDLTEWTTKGVFLLNKALTVRESTPKSHLKIWNRFTDEVIKRIENKTNAIFVLMGGSAKGAKSVINSSERIIELDHPRVWTNFTDKEKKLRYYDTANLFSKMKDKGIEL